MMGLDNPLHIAFLLVIVLLVFGAKRLPEMGKSLGAGLRGFKDSVSGEHDHESLLTTTEPAPERVGDPPAPEQVNGDSARQRTPTQPVA